VILPELVVRQELVETQARFVSEVEGSRDPPRVEGLFGRVASSVPS